MSSLTEYNECVTYNESYVDTVIFVLENLATKVYGDIEDVTPDIVKFGSR
jgi:hypothetical protein